MVSKHAKDLENLNLYVPAKLPVKINPNYFLPHHFASQFQPQKVIKGHLLLHISWRGLPLHRVVQQPTNVRFDHCDLSSFLYFKGDLVVGKVPRYVINPQRRQPIEVVQSNPVNILALPAQPFHSPPFSLPSFFLALRIFIWARRSTYYATSFQGQCTYLKTLCIRTESRVLSTMARRRAVAIASSCFIWLHQ